VCACRLRRSATGLPPPPPSPPPPPPPLLLLLLQASVCGIKLVYNSVSLALEEDFLRWCADEHILIVHAVEENYVQAVTKRATFMCVYD
jgi:hypothetical protein